MNKKLERINIIKLSTQNSRRFQFAWFLTKVLKVPRYYIWNRSLLQVLDQITEDPIAMDKDHIAMNKEHIAIDKIQITVNKFGLKLVTSCIP